MKTILISITLLLSVNAFSQSPNDSAYTKNLPLRASTTFFLTPRTIDPSNDSLFLVFIKWRASQRASQANGNTLVTIDSIPSVELANLYGYILQLPAGLDILTIVRNQLTAARAANPYLERLCKALEDQYAAQLQNMVQIGKRLQLGR